MGRRVWFEQLDGRKTHGAKLVEMCWIDVMFRGGVGVRTYDRSLGDDGKTLSQRTTIQAHQDGSTAARHSSVS
jgi:hypothetical protein